MNSDYQKLNYFYYAETYVNFNDLVVDLFKLYKTRVWMWLVNPTTVVKPASPMQVSLPSPTRPSVIINSNALNQPVLTSTTKPMARSRIQKQQDDHNIDT